MKKKLYIRWSYYPRKVCKNILEWAYFTQNRGYHYFFKDVRIFGFHFHIMRYKYTV